MIKKNFLKLLPLFALAACGSGQQTSTSLEISRSFAVTNPNYRGGLIVTGRNITTGQNFSRGLINNNSLNYNLDVGTWVFTAVGWDGGGTSGTEKIFAGKPYCGIVQQALSGTSATVTINLSETTCATPAFAGTLPSGTPGKYLRKLKAITTCNTFFPGALLPTDTISSKLVNSATSLSYCDSLADDLKTEVKSVRIHSMSKDPYQLTPGIGIMSECLAQDTANPSVINSDSPASPTNAYGTNFDLRLPLKGVPYIITLFKETNCTKPIARYDFDEDLLTSNSNFDHLLLDNNGNSDEVKLVLPGNDMKRGLSPLAHLLPYFKKAGGTRFPTEAIVSEDYHAYVGVLNSMIIDQPTCGTFGTHSNVNASPPGPTCTDLGDEIEIKFTPISAATGYVVMDGTNYTFLAEVPTGSVRFDSNKILWNILGPTNPSMSKNRFYGDPLNDNDSDYGFLSEIRSMFSAKGAGGVMAGFNKSQTFENACLNYVDENEVTLFNYEKMSYETYKLRIHNTKISSPGPYLRDLTSRDSGTIIEDFDKRMLIWDYQEDLVNPIMVLEFSCSELLGSFESYMIHPESSGNRHERMIINWNTNTSGTGLENQRFEVLKQNITKNSGGITIKDDRTISRTDKLPGGNDYANWHYSFVSTYDGTNWTELIEYYDQRTETNNVCYMRDTASGATYTYRGEIFADSDSTITTLRARVPGAGTSAYYTINATFPQAVTASACASSLPLFTSTNGGDLVNSTLPFKLDSLGTSFPGQFGGSFFTAP